MTITNVLLAFCVWAIIGFLIPIIFPPPKNLWQAIITLFFMGAVAWIIFLLSVTGIVNNEKKKNKARKAKQPVSYLEG